MKIKLKNILPLIGAMSLFLFASAFADNDKPSAPMLQSKSEQGTYQRGMYREITPSAGPRVVHCADLFITADFIWWYALQEGNVYFASGFQDPQRTDLDAPRGRVAEVGRDWSPGFKVGIGLNLAHDGWDIYAEYTWLHAHDHDSLTIQPIAIFRGMRIISADWHLHFNVIDVELGRNFYLNQFLTMRPFIGLKGTWQEQDLQLNERLADNTVIDFLPAHLHQHTDVWGIGVRGGFNIAWYMTKSWSIYGDFAWTAMWTDYDLTEKLRRTPLGQIASTLFYNSHLDSHYSVKYIGELELGVRWEIWFDDDKTHFAIQAGWEEQAWINWNTAFPVDRIDIWNNLSFHGLNLKFRFDF